MGDAGLSSISLQTFFDTQAFHTNFLRLIVDNQHKGCTNQPRTTIYGPCTHGSDNASVFFNGSVPDVVPFSTGPYGDGVGSVDWQAAFVMIARAMLRSYGERAVPILTEVWPSLQAFVGYLDRQLDAQTGLLLTGARGDWVPPDGQPYSTPAAEVSAFTHLLCMAYMAEIGEAVGDSEASADYKRRVNAGRAAYHAHFFNDLPGGMDLVTSDQGVADSGREGMRGSATRPARRCCYGLGSQTSNIFALYIGATPTSLVNRTATALAQAIANRTAGGDATGGGPPFGPGPHLDIGIFGTTWVFETLQLVGLDALALDILNEATYPSFGYMTKQGATTLWEGWSGDEHTIGESSSRNHIMFGGGVARFLLAAVGGIATDTSPLAPLETAGWRRVLIRPVPAAIRALGAADAARSTALGDVNVSWRLQQPADDGATDNPAASATLVMNVSLPVGANGVAELPLLLRVSPLSQTDEQGRNVAARVVIGDCELLCALGSSAAPSADGRCSELWASARCDVRQDGEMVLCLDLPSGQHSFAVHQAVTEM